ncbi:MAG: hypothetical protein PHQ00_06355 [Phycisphaerae bacterium]|nr:hypothetical protein [Phycisphaerae bacterium]
MTEGNLEMVKKTTTKTSGTKVRESLRRAEGELTKNEENIARMRMGISIPDDEPLDFGDTLPLSLKAKLDEMELEFFRSEVGIAASRKLKVIQRLKKLSSKS